MIRRVSISRHSGIPLNIYRLDICNTALPYTIRPLNGGYFYEIFGHYQVSVVGGGLALYGVCRCRFYLRDNADIVISSYPTPMIGATHYITIVGWPDDFPDYDPYLSSHIATDGSIYAWAFDTDNRVLTAAQWAPDLGARINISRNVFIDEITAWRGNNAAYSATITGNIHHVEFDDNRPVEMFRVTNKTYGEGNNNVGGFHWVARNSRQAILMPTDGEITFRGNLVGVTDTQLRVFIKVRTE